MSGSERSDVTNGKAENAPVEKGEGQTQNPKEEQNEESTGDSHGFMHQIIGIQQDRNEYEQETQKVRSI
jgi:hypothetical protein